MRTKTLLLTAAIMAAGVAASMAQSNVYSLNVVGYVNVPVKTGFNMLANPLDNGAGNHIGDLFPAGVGDDNATVFSYAGPVTGYQTANDLGGGAWDTDLILAPGTGFWYQSTINTNITFVGTVIQGTTTNNLRLGFTLAASIAPVAKPLGYVGDGQTTNTWQFPANNDSVFVYNNPGGYTTYNFIGVWDDATTLGPVTTVGKGFFVQRTENQAWVETFTVQ